jgi:predicted amidohydrolase YtcJ
MKLFYNAIFHTMKSENDTVKAILIENGVIVKTFNEIPEKISAEKIDLQGNHVFPGLIDTHTHAFEGGLYSLSADLGKVCSLQDVFDLIESTEPIGNMLFAYQFDENLIREKRFPTMAELDSILSDIPLLLRRIDGHSCVINSAAAKQIPWEKPLPSNFNGILRRRENDFVANWFHQKVNNTGIMRAYQKAAEIALKNGLTTIHTMIGDGRNDPEHLPFLQKHLAKFPIEFILYPQITDVKTVLNLGLPRIGGCILADGSFGSHTAGLKQPYFDQPENVGCCYQTNEYWENFVQEAHAADLQVFIHAIGDAAIQQVIDAYKNAQLKSPKNLRHAVIHNELTDDAMLDDMAKFGMAAVMQPMFDRLWAGKNGLYEQVLGVERTKSTNRFRSILNRNILLAGSSDWYVTDLNPFAAISAASNMHHGNQSISPYEALQLYTSNAAKLSHDENRLGKIQEAFQADFIVTNTDLTKPFISEQIKLQSVYKKGCVVQ